MREHVIELYLKSLNSFIKWEFFLNQFSFNEIVAFVQSLEWLHAYVIFEFLVTEARLCSYTCVRIHIHIYIYIHMCMYVYSLFSLLSFSSVQFSCSIVSDFLQPYESQHTMPPCPSPTPGVHSNSCPWVSDAIQPSHPLLSTSPPCPQSLPASESFPMSQLFTSGGQNTKF